MPTNLKFKGASYAPSHPTNLKFGGSDGNEDSNLASFAALRPPTGTTVFATPTLMFGFATLSGPRGTSIARYDNSVARGAANWVTLGWQEGANSRVEMAAPFGESTRLPVLFQEPWVAAAPLPREAEIGYTEAATMHRTASVVWGEGEDRGLSVEWHMNDGASMPRNMRVQFEEGALLAETLKAVHEEARPIRPRLDVLWQEGRDSRLRFRMPFRPKGTRRIITRRAPWQEGRVPLPGRSYVPPPAPTPAPAPLPCYIPPKGGAANLRFLDLWDGSRGIRFTCGNAVIVVPPPGTVVVPVKRVYIVINETSLRRVDGNLLLPTYSMSASLDFQSWTWSFSASLPASELANLEPSADGVPVEVEAKINGTAYRFLIERRRRTRTFGKASISVQGRGKAALLDAPYAPPMEFAQADERTHQQLFDDVLSVNGVSLGWGIDYNLSPWTVPGNVFSHQGTYVSAINRLAEAGGGYVQPHRTAQSLRVLPLYPSAPWDWASATPDFVLPADVTTQEDIEWISKPVYNRVFVTGSNTGVLGQVTRTGTAGDRVAPLIVDALTTEALAARQRGLPVLADTGTSANVTLRLPVLAETGVIEPGAMVDYDDGGVTRRGLVRSVGVDASMPEVWQTLMVETRA